MSHNTDPDAIQRLLDDRAVERFLALEARLADEGQYKAWEDLWTDDALYWVPANDDNADPQRQVSYIYDNRARITSRIDQILTGTRHAQNPASRLRRVLSNLEVDYGGNGVVNAAANFMLMEIRHGEQRLWAGRTLYSLRREGDSFRMQCKKVLLADNAVPIRTLAFLI